MPKLVVGELDVKLSKRDVIKLCENNNISWLEYTNVNGGKYIECIVKYNYELDRSEFLDIYYNCISNRKLYAPTFTKSKQFYVDLIMEYFVKDKEFPKLFTDCTNRLFVFEKEEEGFLYFRTYQFWDKSESADLFKITLKDLMKHFSAHALPFETFEYFSGQDKIAYHYMLDKIAKYL